MHSSAFCGPSWLQTIHSLIQVAAPPATSASLCFCPQLPPGAARQPTLLGFSCVLAIFLNFSRTRWLRVKAQPPLRLCWSSCPCVPLCVGGFPNVLFVVLGLPCAVDLGCFLPPHAACGRRPPSIEHVLPSHAPGAVVVCLPSARMPHNPCLCTVPPSFELPRRS